MATKKKVKIKKSKKSKGKTKGKSSSNFTVPTDVTIAQFAEEGMKEYGTYVLSSRAIPDYRDGLKPVNRRILWAMYVEGTHHNKPFVKSARTSGNVMGKYHPHGSSYNAMVNMAQEMNSYPTVEGQGNWGNILGDGAAADRYTEARISPLGDNLMMEKGYMNVAEMVPNFDGALTEPLYLPALIPYVLLSGINGIAVGTTTNIPPFEINSVMSLVKKILKGKTITPKTCLNTLEFAYRGGAVCVSEDEDLLEYYKTGKGTIRFSCDYTFDKNDDHKFYIDQFTPTFNPDKMKDKLLNSDLPIDSVTDEGDSKGDKIAVCLKTSVPTKRLEDTAEEVCDLLTASQAYRTNISIRNAIKTTDSKSGKVTFVEDHQLKSVTIPELIHMWVDYRVELEAKYLKFLIAKTKSRIEYLNLMRFAISKLDVIFKVLRSKAPNLNEALAKAIKITEDEARTILDKQVRSLSNMSDSDLAKQLKELKDTLSEHKADLKSPEATILKGIKGIDYSKYASVQSR